MAQQTPSQTVGPFFHYALIHEGENVMVDDATQGQRIRIEGRVTDGAGDPVPDAMIEIWQANAGGRYNHPDDDRDDIPLDPAFKGYGRAATGEDGVYWFETIKPGQVPGRGNAMQAPHVNVVVFARGLLIHPYTRLYFPDEAANEIDPVLSSIEDTARRDTLIAGKAEAIGKLVYRFDIVLQGEGETVFFDA
jgi:protocatechuate 3,4-dioxygenase alpha subunit